MVMQTFRVVLLVLLLLSSAYGFEAKDYVTYFGTTDESITVGWSCTSCLTNESYDVQLLHVERDQIVAIGNTSQQQITFYLARSGHYICHVRTVAEVDEVMCLQGQNNIYEDGICRTPWIESINPNFAKVDDNPRAWWIYGYVAPPGLIVIETE